MESKIPRTHTFVTTSVVVIDLTRVVPCIQAAWRGYIVRKKELGWIVAQIDNHRRSVWMGHRQVAALQIQRVFRGWVVRKFAAVEVSTRDRDRPIGHYCSDSDSG